VSVGKTPAKNQGLLLGEQRGTLPDLVRGVRTIRNWKRKKKALGIYGIALSGAPSCLGKVHIPGEDEALALRDNESRPAVRWSCLRAANKEFFLGGREKGSSARATKKDTVMKGAELGFTEKASSKRKGRWKVTARKYKTERGSRLSKSGRLKNRPRRGKIGERLS